jgi:hypothetical protein
METAVVRQMVQQYRERTAYAGTDAHCFTPWYLHQTFQLSETQAEQQSSDGNYDFGVDGFHLTATEGIPTLVLIQAKFSESVQLVLNGFRDFERILYEIARTLDGVETEEPVQNKVIVNLRAELNRLDEKKRHDLAIDFRVVSLSSEDETVLASKLRETLGRLKEAFENVLPDRTCNARHVGPEELGPARVMHVPPTEIHLRLLGAHEFIAGNGGRMLSGIGRLSDLVELYRLRRDDLFSRNVRYYLREKRNTEKGPAGRMRATLKDMCVEGTTEPERFALFHNGITIYSSAAKASGEIVALRDPYVINGCQTIKSAFLFRHDPHLKNRIKDDSWERVSVPVRIVITRDDQLVRTITVNNNRQNSMSPAALRANDRVQIRLEQRFKARRIIYQRQEGAFDDVRALHPEWLDDEYENTRGTWVDIVELARAIAATAGELRFAMHANDLFESDAAYERCFSEETRLRSIVFLTFLQNVHDTIGLILKKNLDLEPRPGGPRPSRLIYHVMCLLMRYLARENMSEFVLQWGTRLHYRDGDFREAIRKILNSHKSGIRGELARRFMVLESGDGVSLSEAFSEIESALGLKVNSNAFEAFADLDEILSAQTDNEELSDAREGDDDTADKSGVGGNGSGRRSADVAGRRFRDEMLGDPERGLSVTEIARLLGYEESTVRSYLSSPQRTHEMGDRIRGDERVRTRALAIVARRRADD